MRLVNKVNQVDPVYLYILMRNGLVSMNAGKAVAQGAHAANQAVRNAKESGNDFIAQNLIDWEEDRAFGTTITLAVTEQQMRDVVAMASEYDELISGIVHDPTYPLADGDTTHLLALDTCGYVFGCKSVCQKVIPETIGLMP